MTAGLAIYDTMQYIKCDIETICNGMAASMGSFLLSGGTKGKRLALPNAEIMIHQPPAALRDRRRRYRSRQNYFEDQAEAESDIGREYRTAAGSDPGGYRQG